MVNGSGYTKDEIVRLGREIYERDIRAAVERDNDGRFLVVDITTGHYEIVDDELTAFDRAGLKNPDGAFFLLRVGRRAAHRLGGRLFSSGSCTQMNSYGRCMISGDGSPSWSEKIG